MPRASETASETAPRPARDPRAAPAWRPAEAARWAAATAPPELGLRVYGSRLLGDDPALVFAGGGNTSVKGVVRDLHGEPVEAIWVKGSGADLARVEPRDFTPLALAPVRRLLDLPRLADRDLARELLRLRLDPEAPPPSVEALLHAFLPFRFVDHAHPVTALALLGSAGTERRARELWGDDCLIVPYLRPGFGLARRCRELWRRAERDGRHPRGIVLLRHGLFAFADEARASYERLVELAARAEGALPQPRRAKRRARTPPPLDAAGIARLRAAISRAAGRPLALALVDTPAARRWVERADLARVARRGPLTPDHVLRTRRLPLVLERPEAPGPAVERYAEAYRREFERLRAGRDLAPLDPAPRVVLVPGTGLLGAGRTPAEARAAATIAEQTAAAIERAEAAGGWRPLGARAIFEVEYWELEQAKLARAGAPRPLAGRAALVTGSASGIGRASAAALLAQGAAVVGLDLAPSAIPGPDGDEYLGLEGDAADPATLARAIETAARRFGGLDVVVANAGVFFAGPTIAELTDADWRRTMAINLDAQLALLRAAIPLLRAAPGGGAIVVVGSKNVRAPGPGAAAYSASKAALTQLARVAALELAGDGVRVNVVHPDAVFDTGVWAGGMLEARAARYGLSVEQYRRRNLLAREVTAADVGALVAALAGDLFAKTTGAQIPVDGGNERTV